jgi:TonB family protein
MEASYQARTRHVTSSRLVPGSGIASIDPEVQAMVLRSSPFPPPPSGRAQSFTVPVSFRLN